MNQSNIRLQSPCSRDSVRVETFFPLRESKLFTSEVRGRAEEMKRWTANTVGRSPNDISQLRQLEDKISEVARLRHFENKELFESRFLSENLADLQSLNCGLHEQLESSRANNSIIERVTVEASQVVADLVEDSERLREDICEEEKKAVSSRSRSAVFEAEIDHLERELEVARKLESSLKLAETEKIAKKRQLEEMSHRLVSEVRRLRASAESGQLELETCATDELALVAEGHKLRSQLDDINQKTDDLRQRMLSTEVEMADIRDQLDRKNQTCDELKADLQRLSRLGFEFSKLHVQYSEQINDVKKRADLSVLSRLAGDNDRIDRLQDELNETLRSMLPTPH